MISQTLSYSCWMDASRRRRREITRLSSSLSRPQWTPLTVWCTRPAGCLVASELQALFNFGSRMDGPGYRLVTVSTVVLNCCKADRPSPWEYPILDPCSSKTPWPILMKFVSSDYVVDPTTHAKLGFQGSNGSVPPYWWNIHPKCLFFMVALCNRADHYIFAL